MTKTLKEIREICKNQSLSGFYCKGELFINNKTGETLFNRYIDYETANELCEELGINLEEV